MATIDIKLKTYDELSFEITTLNTKLFLKDKEIERLSKEVTKYDEILCERNNEVDRLNNIIDELEKWLKSEISYWEEDYETLMCSNKVIYLEEVLDKLKELKEGK